MKLIESIKKSVLRFFSSFQSPQLSEEMEMEDRQSQHDDDNPLYDLGGEG